MCGSCKSDFSPKYFILAKICDKRGIPLSIGWNSYVKTHPLWMNNARKCHLPLKEFVHAEAMAIIRLLPQHIDKAYSMMIYRFDKSGRPQLAKPCPICQKMIECAGIKHVFYTTPNDSLDMDFETYKEWKSESRGWIN